jgi:hypothetical protein
LTAYAAWKAGQDSPRLSITRRHGVGVLQGETKVLPPMPLAITAADDPVAGLDAELDAPAEVPAFMRRIKQG